MPLPENWTTEQILALSFIKGLNSAAIKLIVEKYESLNHLLSSKLPPMLAPKFNQTSMFGSNTALALDKAKKQTERCHKLAVSIITFWDDAYPLLLKEISLPPIILFVKGQLQDRSSLSISIVGKRDCTIYGRNTARMFAEYFAKQDVIVTSGMARGIDTYSHLAAIKNGGITYAVIASGIDEITMKYAQETAHKIVARGGAIISEYPCGVKAHLGYFIHRNRIISGISKATIIIESSARGGSLNTARFAFEQFREVYAVPGNITSKESAGTNNLIKKQSATPVTDPSEILIDLGYRNENDLVIKEKAEEFVLNSKEERIYDILSLEPIHVDELALKADLEIPTLLVTLLDLELKGAVKTMPGNYYIKN